MRAFALAAVLFPLLAPPAARAQGSPRNVLIVANKSSAVSRTISEYYARKREVPAAQVCYIDTPPIEQITRQVFQTAIVAPITKCLAKANLREQVFYIVTTLGVPLGIPTVGGVDTDAAAVDSELAMLYSDLARVPRRLNGPHPNPFFDRRDEKFSHPRFPIYLVTRLAGYDFADVKAIIDRSLQATNRGKVILDMRDDSDEPGNNWLRDAAIRLPNGRFLLENSRKVLYGQKDVIGYASWGSNDKNRHERFLGFEWLPGAIMTENVSTNARTFERPPASWNLSTWQKADEKKWFFGSPQSMTADYIHEGATGASGHVYEPFLGYCPRPEILFPAYLQGRNLAESYYLAIPALSWMNVVIGDPLCRLR